MPLTDGAQLPRQSPASVDPHPWLHPFLTDNSITRFRAYSEEIWSYALSYAERNGRPRHCAFAVNMAQNMYKWARLAQAAGWSVAVYPHPLDTSALNAPEWEDYDGACAEVMDGESFLRANSALVPEVPCRRVPMDGGELLQAYKDVSLHRGRWLSKLWKRLCLVARAPSVQRHALLTLNGFYPYFRWAEALSRYDVIYAASAPFAAYASGKPFCVCSVGGDLELDCGRTDDLGRAMRLAFHGARFLMISNPHALGHSRRLGFTNGVYLPYPMDSNRYHPGDGNARAEWEVRYGAGIYALATSRLDKAVKGQGESFFDMLVAVTRERPRLRFVFLAWGDSALEFHRQVESAGMADRIILLPPVGKKRLIDYYRSCDFVLDHFVYGYYGATALEAAAIGKPVIMKLRAEHYAPLYAGDVAPVSNVSSPEEVRQAILAFADNPSMRAEQGRRMREWLVRNHGEERTVPLMLALLRLAADRVRLPRALRNPLCDPLGPEEEAYHAACAETAA
ncbi:MAG: glycosyltransferase [Gammaproteobacteria bacterium]